MFFVFAVLLQTVLPGLRRGDSKNFYMSVNADDRKVDFMPADIPKVCFRVLR